MNFGAGRMGFNIVSNAGLCYQQSWTFVKQKATQQDNNASKDSEDGNVFKFSVTQLKFDIIIPCFYVYTTCFDLR